MTEHELLEAIAADLDSRADDIFGSIAHDGDGSTEEAQALRRAAEIIRYQVECEA